MYVKYLSFIYFAFKICLTYEIILYICSVEHIEGRMEPAKKSGIFMLCQLILNYITAVYPHVEMLMHSQLPSGMFDNGSVDSRFYFPIMRQRLYFFFNA